MGDEFSLEDALIILRRRFLFFFLPFIALAAIGVVTVMLLPAKYTAEGKILVESQQIPTELIRSTINAYAQERIQTIQQRVMTRNRLLEVEKKYQLFPPALRLSESERVKRMRNRLNVSLITTNANRASSRDGTIAFTVSYTDGSAEKAFLVANEFMTLFLSEDVRTRTTGASNTTEFFERETTRLRTALNQMETQITNYKNENSKALPEHLNMHLDMLSRANQELSNTQSSIGAMEEQLNFLETQLLSGGSADDQQAGDLSRLQGELARLRGIYHDRHPSIESLKSEIAALRRQLAPSEKVQTLRAALSDAEAAATALENDPNATPEAVVEAQTTAVAAREALSEAIRIEARRGATDPQGVQLEGRIAVLTNRIKTLNNDRERKQLQIADLEARIANTPNIERGLAALTRDRENLFREYDAVLAKQQAAQRAENLEENQQAEKFSILEPAQRPDSPSSPNRPQLALLALIAAAGVGGAAALGVELMFSTIRGRDHLARLIGGHPIAIVPYIPTPEDKGFSMPFSKAKKAPPAAHDPGPEPTPEPVTA